MSKLTRRGVLAAGIAFPTIVPATVFGQNAPSNRINIGVIGVGRIARGHDMAETFKYDHAQILAVCDVDSKRLALGKQLVDETYSKKYGRTWDSARTYADYHALLAAKDIDAVIVATPDHQHAILAVHAVKAGKDVYLQKPASLTIAEGRTMADAV